MDHSLITRVSYLDIRSSAHFLINNTIFITNDETTFITNEKTLTFRDTMTSRTHLLLKKLIQQFQPNVCGSLETFLSRFSPSLLHWKPSFPFPANFLFRQNVIVSIAKCILQISEYIFPKLQAYFCQDFFLQPSCRVFLSQLISY